MNQVTIFRFLVVASLAIAVLGACVDFLIPGLLPQVLDDAYQAYAAAEEPSMLFALTLGGVALVLLIGVVAGTIGLLLFKSWSRQLSLWLSVFAIFCSPFSGPVVYSGWANMLTEISMMLWGAVLAMAYFSEVKVRFSGDFANNDMQATREDDARA
jgi:hypothetical protein